MKKIVFFLWIIFPVLLWAQPGTINSHTENSQVVRDLGGHHWKMKMMLPGQGVKEGLHELPPADIETNFWNPAFVPGDVYTDLWKCGVIDDPYFGRNSVRAQWVQQYEWWYAYQFNVTEDVTDQVVRLVFEGVDYSCDVWLNGVHLGSHKGAFSSFSFDINDVLRVSKKNIDSKNMLMIKLDPPPKVNAKVAGLKTPWFGDYWRDLIPFGISRTIKMVSTGKVRIMDVYANTSLNKDGSADVRMEVELENTTDQPKEMTIVASMEGKNFESKSLMEKMTQWVKPGKHIVTKTIHVKKPLLWWPWDLGKPNLYTAKVSLKEGAVNHDAQEITFGIREVSSKWNPGFKRGVDVSFPRSTYINGKFHFIRSACWGGPPDIFVGRTNPDEYKTLIRLAKEANLNNIRIFGWHPPEIPEFYEYCNEMGMTVWQDMIPLGTGNIPQDRKGINRIMQEAAAVIKERRNHPSLIMMEGGEEMLLRTQDAHFGRAFLEELGDTLQRYAKLPYVPDSPLTCEVSIEAGFKPKEAKHALAYFYGMGRWLMEDWFRTLDYPIIPEFAITSVPNVESLKKFIPENEMWPPGLSWGHHWADLDRLRMQNWDSFGDEKLGSLQEFVDATQDAQGMIFQYGVEYLRRHKPNLSGISLCHWITYWPDMKWGIIDNYQQPKRSYEFVKRAYQPLLVNLNFEKRRWHREEPFKGELWVVNDLYQSFGKSTVEMEVRDDKGKRIFSSTFNMDKVDENSAQKYFDIEADVLSKVNQQFTIHLNMKDKAGNSISSNEYLFLIGDQKEASAQFKKMGDAMRKRNAEFTYGNYFRFFDEMGRKNGKDYQSDTEHPKASEYE
ncbi:glycoside hydrolase family 2 protein [Saccharicrinis fermentans]|uniref:Beta-mannosidase B n=1 Tax=Saccharicrinis fermentans DSM 9555 = JCM 21142 TaxID=869213 RepID=W7Y8C1_9BACT|nr:sugar-binding domain-containing protein [Saccharicrinis fermentans]GAF04497.1 exo-beta-D-glucosaminidase precursor [Saccharicrinis fermentans DSM 9555 = JCM 21142]